VSWPGYLHEFLEWSAVRGLSAATVQTRERSLRRFIAWCTDRQLQPADVTRPLIERYQRHLHHARKRDGEPLALSFQQQLLLPLNALFGYLVRVGHLHANPAADLDLPRLPKRLPRSWLSVEEVEQVLAHVALYGVIGVRDRAIIETFYSTGLRRFELVALTLRDVDARTRIVRVRHGKGDKERLVPIGERALAWLLKYREEVRPLWQRGPDDGRLWLCPDGKPLRAGPLTERLHQLLAEAGIDKPGACHIFRHTMATQMLENGADVRFVQAMLGHAQLGTTEIYTHVAIGKLQAIHAATHPSAKLARRPKSPA
jgi:integrase/recombinase XerD